MVETEPNPQDSCEVLNQSHQPEEPAVCTGRFRKVVKFVRVSPVQQLFTAINFASAANLGIIAAEKVAEGNYYSAMRLAAVTLLNLAFLGFNEAQAVGRYGEYKKVKEALTRYGWSERIIEPKSHSWCQRNAARRAAIDTGHREEIDRYYEEQGYNWHWRNIFSNIYW